MRILGSARARAAVLLSVAAATLTVAGPASAGTANFSGTITDAATGEPLGGICVLVWKLEDNTAYEQYPESCTESDGLWSKTDLDPGTYYVGATGHGWVRQFAYGQANLWDSQQFTVADGESVTVDLAMERAGEVTGTVTDAVTGEPVSVCVSVNGNDYWENYCTGEDGYYSVFVRPASDYVVQFSDWTGRYMSEYAYDTTDYEAAERFTVVAGETLVVNEELDRAATIAGSITDAATGAPVPHACVLAISHPDSIDGVAGYACADETGAYLMSSVTPGTFYVGADDESGAHVRTWHPAATDPADSTLVTIESGQELTGVDIALAPAGYVSGTVTDVAGAPMAGVCVSGVLPDGSWSRNGGPASCSDADGNYTLGGLPTADVKVFFNPLNDVHVPQWAYGQDTEATAALIPVTAGQTTSGVNAAIKEGGRIAGRVVNAKTKQPVEGVCATVGVFQHRAGENGTQWQSACTGPDGTYEMRGLPTGSYTVEFYDPDGVWAWQFFPNKADRVQAARLEVTAGETLSGINAKLSPGGTVEGVVVDEATGEPAEFVCLDAFTARQHDSFGTSSCTGADGRYVLRGFPTGKVKVSAWDGGGDWQSEWAFDQVSFETATPIATTAGGTTTANLSVSRS